MEFIFFVIMCYMVEDMGIDSHIKPLRAHIAETALVVDPMQKALTGRTPERISDETGIPREVMFPDTGRILYVGDPWQRMGKEIDDQRLTLIDYEYGETASFVRDIDRFKHDIAIKTGNTLKKLDYLKHNEILIDSDREWIRTFEELFRTAAETIANTDDILLYPQAADRWHAAKKCIEDAYRQEQERGDAGDAYMAHNELSYLRTDAWYACVAGERGFRDLYDWEHIILPKIKQKEEELTKKPDITDEERKTIITSWIQTWINEIRLKKKPEKAHVVVGVFPQLPFKDHTFNRLVASWSISAHLFAYLNEDEFGACWREINRVLDDKGEAYIFPLTYSDIDELSIMNSLEQARNTIGMDYELLDNTGALVPDTDFYSATTLHIKRIPSL